MGEDNQPVYRLRHTNNADADYTHTDAQLICGEHLGDWLQAKTDEGDPACFINQAAGCGGVVHPCEYSGILVNADFTQATRDRYRAAYNIWARAQGRPEAQGGAKRKINTRKYRSKKHKKTRKY
jgi:hypothetical protein